MLVFLSSVESSAVLNCVLHGLSFSTVLNSIGRFFRPCLGTMLDAVRDTLFTEETIDAFTRNIVPLPHPPRLALKIWIVLPIHSNGGLHESIC